MKKSLAILTLALGLTISATGLITAAHAQTSEYDPYYGFNGGYRFKGYGGEDQGGAQWDPYAGFNGGWRVTGPGGSRQGTWEYDPYAGFNGGYRFRPN
jgi:hypothetical protein